ncbi:MAG: hypothetical protein ABIA47_04815 [bacterium]
MVKVLQFPGVGGRPPERPPVPDEQGIDDFELDDDNTMETLENLQAVEEDEGGAEVISLGARQEGKAREDTRSAMSKMFTAFGGRGGVLGELAKERMSPEKTDDFDQFNEMKRHIMSLQGRSGGGKRASAIQLRKNLLKDYSEEELAEELRNSSPSEWTARPSHYEALAQLLEESGYFFY